MHLPATDRSRGGRLRLDDDYSTSQLVRGRKTWRRVGSGEGECGIRRKRLRVRVRKELQDWEVPRGEENVGGDRENKGMKTSGNGKRMMMKWYRKEIEEGGGENGRVCERLRGYKGGEKRRDISSSIDNVYTCSLILTRLFVKVAAAQRI